MKCGLQGFDNVKEPGKERRLIGEEQEAISVLVVLCFSGGWQKVNIPSGY
jgi:hypothetical protein